MTIDTIKTNFALRPETIESIEILAERTHRGKSAVIDWLVADAMDRISQVAHDSMTVGQMIDQAQEPTP